MKHLNEYITEYFDPKKINVHTYKYHPKYKTELEECIKKEIELQGNEADLNCIDTSKITDMAGIFAHSNFNGDISEWDVSNVKTMNGMFVKSAFNQDISSWDVSNVKDMRNMFLDSKFDGDLSSWDVQDDCELTIGTFLHCPLENKQKPGWYMKWYHKTYKV